MFTTVAFAENKAALFTDYINGVPDETHRVSGDDIYIGDWNLLLAAFICSYMPSYTYLISPSLRRIAQLYLSPAYIAGAPQAFDRMLARGFDNPLPLDKGEALNCYCSRGGANVARVEMVAVWLADAPVTPIKGEVQSIMINSEAATDFVMGVWKNHELTFTPDLPVGRYQVVGAHMYGADYGVFRFCFRGEKHRPGGLIFQDERLAVDKIFREGGLGVWGEFDSILPPSMDVCFVSTQAATQLWGILDLIKVG